MQDCNQYQILILDQPLDPKFQVRSWSIFVEFCSFHLLQFGFLISNHSKKCHCGNLSTTAFAKLIWECLSFVIKHFKNIVSCLHVASLSSVCLSQWCSKYPWMNHENWNVVYCLLLSAFNKQSPQLLVFLANNSSLKNEIHYCIIKMSPKGHCVFFAGC